MGGGWGGGRFGRLLGGLVGGNWLCIYSWLCWTEAVLCTQITWGGGGGRRILQITGGREAEMGKIIWENILVPCKRKFVFSNVTFMNFFFFFFKGDGEKFHQQHKTHRWNNQFKIFLNFFLDMIKRLYLVYITGIRMGVGWVLCT